MKVLLQICIAKKKHFKKLVNVIMIKKLFKLIKIKEMIKLARIDKKIKKLKQGKIS
jgi:hypothetical protein